MLVKNHIWHIIMTLTLNKIIYCSNEVNVLKSLIFFTKLTENKQSWAGRIFRNKITEKSESLKHKRSNLSWSFVKSFCYYRTLWIAGAQPEVRVQRFPFLLASDAESEHLTRSKKQKISQYLKWTPAELHLQRFWGTYGAFWVWNACGRQEEEGPPDSPGQINV